jgi:choline dehydrogenase-like flavoprotein
MNYVVGSGPAGVAAADSLLQRGLSVTLLDAGGELDEDVKARVARLARLQPEAWNPADRESLKGPLRYNTEGAPLKLAFGSDYVYRDVDRLQPVIAQQVDAYRSLAAGGLSTLWGASMLPYSDADFDGWPLNAADMSPHYVSALELTGLAAEHDRLAKRYPLHIEPTARLNLSRQARHVVERMARHADDLESQHIHFGQARLAISTPAQSIQSCVHCGMCLYGCPYGLIYSAQLTLQARLPTYRAFTYRPGFIVRRLTEEHGAVTIDAIARDTLQPHRFEASRVYLAAGALSSTTILLDSLEAYGQSVPMVQSDHFLLPMLLRGFSGRVAGERLHTLSQLFIEVLDRAISRHGVHLQLYTYNDFYERMARNKLGPAYRPMAPLLERLIDRIVLLKGYVHSDESSRILATVDRTPTGPVLRLEAAGDAASGRVIRAVTRLLGRNRQNIGAVPLRFALRLGLPGSGVHIGGSFPMRSVANGFESDALGRPAGMKRVHVVDSTVFPTVPAPTITLTIMANAFRIAAESQRLEEPPCSI